MKSKTLSVGEITKVLDAKGQKLSDTKAAVAACSYLCLFWTRAIRMIIISA